MKRKEDPDSRLTVVVSLKMSPSEKRALVEKATAAGLTPSAYLRVSVLESRTSIVAIKHTNMTAVRFLNQYLKVVNVVEDIAGPAKVMFIKGQITRDDFFVLLHRLDSIIHLFREGLSHDH